MRLRRSFGALSIILTAAAVCGLPFACGPVTNNWIDHRLASDASYVSTQVAGSSARELLRTDTFKSLQIRIQHVPGFAPSQESLNLLEIFLKTHLRKSHLELQLDMISAQNHPSWSVSEVRELEDRSRSHFSKKDQFVVYYWFLDGHYVDDQANARYLGQAFRNSSVVIYEQTLREEALKSGVNLGLTEATVMEHEFGHLLGLVNIGTPAQNAAHEDLPAHHTHCNEIHCLMNFAADTSAQLAQLNGTPPELGKECKRDLESIQDPPARAER